MTYRKDFYWVEWSALIDGNINWIYWEAQHNLTMIWIYGAKLVVVAVVGTYHWWKLMMRFEWKCDAQMLHVWNIYLHLPKKSPNVGKYTIHGASGMGWNGVISWGKNHGDFFRWVDGNHHADVLLIWWWFHGDNQLFSYTNQQKSRYNGTKKSDLVWTLRTFMVIGFMVIVKTMIHDQAI